jgi:hypothetical protein
MAGKKLSELLDFHGKTHVEAYMKRGQKFCPSLTDGPAMMIFGLISHLIELGVIDELPDELPSIKEENDNVG